VDSGASFGLTSAERHGACYFLSRHHVPYARPLSRAPLPMPSIHPLSTSYCYSHPGSPTSSNPAPPGLAHENPSAFVTRDQRSKCLVRTDGTGESSGLASPPRPSHSYDHPIAACLNSRPRTLAFDNGTAIPVHHPH
jgi:hypothetical protein